MSRRVDGGTGRGARAVAAWLLLALAAAAPGCAPRDPERMVAADPPPSWQEDLARERAVKDEYFGSNPKAPLHPSLRAGFTGLTYWPPAPDYYYLGPINFYGDPARFEMMDTAGERRPTDRVGWIDLVVDGRLQRLQVYHLLDTPPGSFFLPFMDATTGKESYPAGRYVELEGPPGGPWVLDFNRAYNPYCAYGDPDRFACPVTPAENRLEVAIEAGERGYHEREGHS